MGLNKFEERIWNLRPYLLIVARKFSTNFDDVEDLVQDTFIRALLNQDKFYSGVDAPDHELKAWLCVLLKNIYLNKYLKERKYRNNYKNITKHFNEINISKNAAFNKLEAENIMKFLQTNLIRQIQKNSSNKIYNCFSLYLDDYSYKEISAILDIPIGSVKRNINLAREMLTPKLETCEVLNQNKVKELIKIKYYEN